MKGVDFTPFEIATAPLERGTTQLEASAGTGKTYTLAGLFLRLVAEEGLEVGSILVTTFTIPATAELRDRIRRLLRGAVTMFADGPGDHPLLCALHARYVAEEKLIRPRLERALQRFDDALISTIHGFCLRLLEERAFESGLPFDAEPLQDEGLLIQEVADDFWRLRIFPAEMRIGGFAKLASLTQASLARLLRECVARPTMRILPAHAPQSLGEAEHELRAAFLRIETAWHSGETRVREIFRDAERWAKDQMKKPEVTSAALDALARCLTDPTSCHADYSSLDFFTSERVAAQTTVRGKNPPSPPAHPLFDACSDFARARDHWRLSFAREFLAWAPAELSRRKLQRNVLSFGDLLTRLRDALRSGQRGPLIAAARQRFAAALVDEFQDTDPVQAEIFETLFADHGRLYLVGDPKQAIYGFRGADVFSYLEAAARSQHRHELSANQRSVTALVAAVNEIFSRNADAFVVPGIRFRPALAAGRHDARTLQRGGASVAAFQFWLWSQQKPVAAGHAREELPGFVADGIVTQLTDGTTSDGQPLRPSDFAVLTTTNDEADQVRDALVAAGLPAVVLSRARVFSSPEAMEMLTLLHALASPASESAVRAALATTALGHTAASLDQLQDRAWEGQVEKFTQRHLRWAKEGFFPAFRAMLVEERVRSRLLQLPDGERRLTNLLHLAELLHHTASAQQLGPAALVRWLAMQMHDDAGGGEEQELRLESDEQAVKVVTVHKSKGLEFGIVWCPFSWRSAEPSPTAPTTFHDPASRDLVLDLSAASENRHLMAQEHLAEQARLFYVALTRARLQCHLVWGRFNRCAVSAAAWVLHPPGGPAHGATVSLQQRELADGALRQDLSALSACQPGAFAIAEVTTGGRLRYQAPTSAGAPRHAHHFSGRIPHDFTITSFSALTAQAVNEERDRDRTITSVEAAAATPSTGIHSFPRGKRAGTCLHEIFEELDFTQPAAVAPLVERKLQVFGFHRAEWVAAVGACVEATLTAELTKGIRLRKVGPAQRLTELEFHLPVGRLSADSLAAVIGERLSFDPLTGFLKGFIDLVFESGGRFYIVDWKSNWIGPTSRDYTPEAMAAEMRRHHYGLQYQLYALALHRYLATRVPGYTHAEHFGGVFYLFVRGIDAAQAGQGIFHDRPDLQRLTDLDGLISANP